MSTIQKLKEELNTSIIGREKEFDLMLVALLQSGHVLLESLPAFNLHLMYCRPMLQEFVISIRSRKNLF